MEPECTGYCTLTFELTQVSTSAADVSLADVSIIGAYFQIDVRDNSFEGQIAVF